MIVRVSLVFLILVIIAQGIKIHARPTVGEPWPKPQSIQTTTQQIAIHRHAFQFRLNETSQHCDLIENAFIRYYRLIFDPRTYMSTILQPTSTNDDIDRQWMNITLHDIPVLETLYVNIENPCDQWPSLESNESYTLLVNKNHSSLNAISVWGALRGLETFSQLIYTFDDISFFINETTINDFPRFQHRGLLLDTSRHFLPLKIIKMNLEAMAQSKMNVFHFHIVDDQSFPYESRTYPELSNQGAYSSRHVYSQNDIADLIEFARQRGIRVVVEFDTPGHTQSWGRAIDILTRCYSEGKPNGELGPIDPSRNETYIFLKNLFTEIASVFPDHYVHLGGDEVSFECWRSNPDVREFMHQMHFGIDYALLEQYYMQILLDIVNNTGKGYTVWQEVIDHRIKIQKDTLVAVWKEPYKLELARITGLGYRVILSACWYLDHILYGPDWIKYYLCDPHDFIGTEEQKRRVVGGEASMWGEFLDSTNLVSTTWPRASAVAERLWSSVNVIDTISAIPRLEEQRCRYLKRGIAAEPMNGPSYCHVEYNSQTIS